MNKMLQKVLCIKSELIFPDAASKWNGLKTENLDAYYNLLLTSSEFRVRAELEEDPNYKQIIPQVILRYTSDKPRYFLHRQVKANESRLNSLCPLPLGGHVEEFDLGQSADLLQTALEREVSEEAEIKSNIISKKFLGLIYIEDENPVNHVHVGLVYFFDLDGDEVKINEEGLETIGFVDKDYLVENRNDLTYWSRVIVDSL
jgi:predicted NUDIX family phosphoesterase